MQYVTLQKSFRTSSLNSFSGAGLHDFSYFLQIPIVAFVNSVM